MLFLLTMDMLTSNGEHQKQCIKNILVLDAGHGGSDSGATGNRLREKDLTLSIVLAAKKQFDKDKNYAVYYTRTTDTYPSLTDRSDLAKQRWS